jgi:transcriptional regulator with XRE-family HTH domain
MNNAKSCQEYIKELGRRIKYYRVMREMSQQELADKTGISKRSISRLEQGDSVELNSFIIILIALDLGSIIELLVPDQRKRPSYYLE